MLEERVAVYNEELKTAFSTVDPRLIVGLLEDYMPHAYIDETKCLFLR